MARVPKKVAARAPAPAAGKAKPKRAGALDPGDRERRLVEALAAVGMPHAEIAAALGCSRRTAVREFAAELKHGKTRLHAKLLERAVELALGGNVAMLCFLLKTRFGYRETDRPDPGPDGAALIASDPDPDHDEG